MDENGATRGRSLRDVLVGRCFLQSHTCILTSSRSYIIVLGRSGYSMSSLSLSMTCFTLFESLFVGQELEISHVDSTTFVRSQRIFSGKDNNGQRIKSRHTFSLCNDCIRKTTEAYPIQQAANYP